jgi:hypothetical protein
VAARHSRATGANAGVARTRPALYLAKLFGSDDTEAVVRLVTALLVLVLDLARGWASCAYERATLTGLRVELS